MENANYSSFSSKTFHFTVRFWNDEIWNLNCVQPLENENVENIPRTSQAKIQKTTNINENVNARVNFWAGRNNIIIILNHGQLRKHRNKSRKLQIQIYARLWFCRRKNVCSNRRKVYLRMQCSKSGKANEKAEKNTCRIKSWPRFLRLFFPARHENPFKLFVPGKFNLKLFFVFRCRKWRGNWFFLQIYWENSFVKKQKRGCKS